MARKNKFDYFDAFAEIGGYAVEYANKLVAFLEEHYDEEKGYGLVDEDVALAKLTELHVVEENSDAVTHKIVKQLATEFVSPIEREDILELTTGLDNVVDELDDVLQRLYMYNVLAITPEIIEMAHVTKKAVEAVQKACKKFRHFKKWNVIHELAVEIHDFEDEGDKIYIKSVHHVYVKARKGELRSELDAVGIVGVLSVLERCCDACESVADTIITVVTKNS